MDFYHFYFSPFSSHMLEYEGVLYPTVEHCYHCQRYSDPDIRHEIVTARSAFLAWQVSQKYKQQQIDDFPERKVAVMKSLCLVKLEQHQDVRDALVRSRGQEIIKHIITGPKADGFWDDGIDGAGRNELGKIWMELRDDIDTRT